MISLQAVKKFKSHAGGYRTPAVVRQILIGKKFNTFYFNVTTSPQSSKFRITFFKPTNCDKKFLHDIIYFPEVTRS